MSSGGAWRASVRLSVVDFAGERGFMAERHCAAELLDLLERRNEELRIVDGIGKALTSSLDRQEILNVIIEEVSLLLKPRTWSLLLVSYTVSKLQEKIRVQDYPAGGDCRIRVTASFGIASFPEYTQNKHDLIRLADRAVYDVKETTRDAIRRIDPLAGLWRYLHPAADGWRWFVVLKRRWEFPSAIFYARVLRNRRTAKGRMKAPSTSSPTSSGHKTSAPTPLRKTPRMM